MGMGQVAFQCTGAQPKRLLTWWESAFLLCKAPHRGASFESQRLLFHLQLVLHLLVANWTLSLLLYRRELCQQLNPVQILSGISGFCHLGKAWCIDSSINPADHLLYLPWAFVLPSCEEAKIYVNTLHITVIRLLQCNTNNSNSAFLHLHLKGVRCSRLRFSKNKLSALVPNLI